MAPLLHAATALIIACWPSAVAARFRGIDYSDKGALMVPLFHAATVLIAACWRRAVAARSRGIDHNDQGEIVRLQLVK
ncbi:hypothetical protein PPEMPLJA_03023 [Aeromonas salmonicida]